MRKEMKLSCINLLLLSSYVAFAAGQAVEEAPLGESAPIPTFKQGIRFDTFDLNFCKTLYASTEGNAAVSPVSVKLLMGMVYEAASGDTARQIQQALNLGQRLDSRRRFKAILNSLNCDSSSEESCAVKLQSRLFISPNAHYSTGYRRVLYTHFDAEVQQANFSFPVEAAAVINSWACNATDEKVKQMVTSDDVQSAAMVMANTLLFKGAWEVPFNQASTAKGDFRLKDNRTVQVDMMRTKGSFFTTVDEECGFTLIRLPYLGGQFSLYLVLPKEVDGLVRLVEQLTPESIREAILVMKKKDIHLTMPKLNLKHKVDAKSILTKLGISKIFSSAEAELPKLSKDNSIHVSKIIHEAGLEVDEHGSTAFAATQMQLQFKMFTEATLVVVDRPFVLFIKDDAAETVVFAAKVENPLGATPAAPEARALVNPEAPPMPTTKVTLYPPNFFPSSLNETKVLLQKLNASSAGLDQVAGAAAHRESSVVMRIPPKEARKISKEN